MYEHLKLDNQLCFRLYTAARLVMQAYFPYFEPLGITYPQYLVLLVLWEKDHQPVNDIAHLLHLETNTVTPLLQRMEKQGLVTRKRGKEDTRQRIVSLTPQGKALEEKAQEIPECLLQQLSDRMDDINCLMGSMPALDALIEGLTQKAKSK
ncbi:MAG: MarR family transcriptional regulator [Paludibacteraceae bacterium]|nr:MarR family transcriptional regulator [Paludibacteraceae bacterium]